jgi:hypothetical protein
LSENEIFEASDIFFVEEFICLLNLGQFDFVEKPLRFAVFFGFVLLGLNRSRQDEIVGANEAFGDLIGVVLVGMLDSLKADDDEAESERV